MIICLTGIDGCGKSVQAELLKNYLESKSQTVFLSKAYDREEKSIFSGFINCCDQIAILFLFQALHAQQRIKAEKALSERKTVIADRWDEGYLAYHANYGILSDKPELREKINEMAFDGIKPDVTFLIDLPVEEANKRCILRQKGTDFFDLLPPKYHEVMRKGYLDLAKIMNWIVIDGRLPEITIHRQIVSHLKA